MSVSIPYQFRLDKSWGSRPFPYMHLQVWLRGKEVRLGSAGNREYLGIIDTGADHCSLPRAWLEELGVWDDPQRISVRTVRTVRGQSNEMVAEWDLSFALNTIEMSGSVLCVFHDYPKGSGLPCAILGQNLLGAVTLYHEPHLNRGRIWTKTPWFMEFFLKLK